MQSEKISTEVTFQTQAKNLLIYKVSSPTTVWFSSLYLTGLLSMIGFNLGREGLNLNGLTGGPSYYSRVFLYYGLNGNSTFDTPWVDGILAWIFAPFIAIWLGLTLFYLKHAGYSKNGGTFTDPDGSLYFAFFNENVYGYGINIFGVKGNLFYIGIVWLPIITASIVTTVYMKRVKRESSIITRFSFNFVIAFWVGLAMAKMTDPNVSFKFQGFFDSLYENRTFNSFVIYEGEYHPMMLALILTLFQLVSILVFGLISSMNAIIISMRQSMERYRIRREMTARRRREGISTLPWKTDDRETNADSQK